MSDIQAKITKHARKQGSVAHDEEKTQHKDTEMTQMRVSIRGH